MPMRLHACPVNNVECHSADSLPLYIGSLVTNDVYIYLIVEIDDCAVQWTYRVENIF